MSTTFSTQIDLLDEVCVTEFIAALAALEWTQSSGEPVSTSMKASFHFDLDDGRSIHEILTALQASNHLKSPPDKSKNASASFNAEKSLTRANFAISRKSIYIEWFNSEFKDCGILDYDWRTEREMIGELVDRLRAVMVRIRYEVDI